MTEQTAHDDLEGTALQRPEGRAGRGAISNASGRFESTRRLQQDDGWGNLEYSPPPLRTQLRRDSSKTIIATNQSPDLGFDRSINPYRGCEHGCIYCFARPSHAFLGYSPGLDFESQILFKPDAAGLLKKALAAKKYRCAPIAMGTNTDPYQPTEKHLGITREILKVMADHGQPVSIVTKAHLVTRDIDILAEMAKSGLVRVALSITSLDNHLARRMEPRASAPNRRLLAVEMLAAADIPVSVMVAPIIPALNDHEMENILQAAAWRGAKSAGYIVLRLPLEVEELWRQWLAVHYPDRAERIMKLVRDCHGGKTYDSRFHHRLKGSGVYARMLARRFEITTRQLALDGELPPLRTDLFKQPAVRPKTPQLSLFAED